MKRKSEISPARQRVLDAIEPIGDADRIELIDKLMPVLEAATGPLFGNQAVERLGFMVQVANACLVDLDTMWGGPVVVLHRNAKRADLERSPVDPRSGWTGLGEYDRDVQACVDQLLNPRRVEAPTRIRIEMGADGWSAHVGVEQRSFQRSGRATAALALLPCILAYHRRLAELRLERENA